MDEIEELQRTLATDVELKSEPDTGVIFERWEILERVGEGGMGIVYKARHQVMKKVGAIKMLHPHLISHGVTLQRFQQEARAASSLQHPNVIAVQDCGVTDNGNAFLIMEYVEGISLSSVIRGGGKLDGKRAANVFIQACRGLQHAHTRGIIHRDLKPSNIMLVHGSEGEEDVVKVVDFGIAKVISQEPDDVGKTEVQGLTRSGEIFGSPLYMSPEQCLGKKVDARTDIYSMGCLMYEALAGEPPFVGESSLDTMQRHLMEAPKALCHRIDCDELVRRLDEVIQKCIAKDVQDRYQSMADLQFDIELAISGCTDQEWKSRAHARKDLSARKKKLAGLPKVSANFASNMVAGALGLGLIAGVGLFGFLQFNSYMEPVRNISSRDYNRLFVRRDESPVVREPPDFDQKEKTLSGKLRVAEVQKAADPAEYAHWLTRHAAVLMSGGKYERALQEFGKAQEIYANEMQRPETDTNLSTARLLMADCYFFMGAKEKARNAYIKLLPNLSSGSTRSAAIKHYRFLAHIDLEKGDNNDALACFHEILELTDSYKNHNQKSDELVISPNSEHFKDAVEAALEAANLRYQQSSDAEGHYGVHFCKAVSDACAADAQSNYKYLALARSGHGRAVKALKRYDRNPVGDMKEAVSYASKYQGEDAALLRAYVYKTYAEIIQKEQPLESWMLQLQARQALNEISSQTTSR